LIFILSAAKHLVFEKKNKIPKTQFNPLLVFFHTFNWYQEQGMLSYSPYNEIIKDPMEKHG
jgi:hypothetical protein